MELKELETKLLKNEEYKKELEKLDLAFEIGQMIIEARIVKGLTQAKLASLIKTKQPSIARLEAGNGLPSLSLLQKIAEVLKTRLRVSFDLVESSTQVTSTSKAKTHTQTVYLNVPGVERSLFFSWNYHVNTSDSSKTGGLVC
jgi:transcriptional regulator with XRE-family HTH domain